MASAAAAPPGEAAQAYNRAGDLCLGAGDPAGALRNYGRAIDVHLRSARYTAAAGLCRKILRIAPAAVRTRCTLAWLAVGRGDADEARREIGAYVDAGERAGETALVLGNLRMMAELTSVPDIRAFVADALERLGAAEAAEVVRRTQPESPPRRPGAAEQERLWRAVVAAALRGPAGRTS